MRVAPALVLSLAISLMAAPALAAAPDGKTIFQRCAACHLATGKGVPGAYPPLTNEPRRLAARPDGRRYLVLVVAKGLAGAITVGGKPFRSVMPAQAGLDDASIAAVLNHVIGLEPVGPAPRPFTAAEVAKIRSGGAAVLPGDLARMHEGLGLK